MRIVIVVAGLVLCACATEARYGITTVPADRATANESVIEAMRKALPQEESSCAVHVIDRTKPTELQSGTEHIATAVICNRIERFTVQIIPTAQDQATVSARRIE
jgi:hypothetical protein